MAAKRNSSNNKAKKRSHKKKESHVPIDILEDRYKRLGNTIKRRGGNV